MLRISSEGGAPKTKTGLINRSIKCSIRTMIDMNKFDSEILIGILENTSI